MSELNSESNNERARRTMLVVGQKAAELRKAIEEGDSDSLMQTWAWSNALHVEKVAPDAFQQIRAEIKSLGRGVLSKWEGAFRQYKAEKRAEDREERELFEVGDPAYVANGGKIAEAIADADGELPECTALEYGRRRKFDPADERMVATLMHLMNKDHAVVRIGGTVRYACFDRVDGFEFHKRESMVQQYENIRIIENGKLKNAFDWWAKWKGRRAFDGVGLYPGSEVNPSEVPHGHLNLWQGFGVEPRKGSWKLLRSHVLDVLCKGDGELCEWLLDWLAQLCQQPQVKPGTAVVLRSDAEGTGKSLLAEAVLKPIFQTAFKLVNQQDQVVGRFNGHLQFNIVMGVEEAVWAGSKQAEGVLKSLVTARSLTVEHKGLTPFSAPNYSRLIVTSNHDWVVPAGPTSRRFFVLNVAEDHAGDRSYFGPLFAELKNGGVEAFLHDMLKRKIVSDLGSPPVTEGLEEQRAHSLDGFDAWLLEIARSGEITATDEKPVAVAEGALVPADHVQASVRPALGPYDMRNMDARLGRLLAGVGVKRVRMPRDIGGRRPWGYSFPDIDEFRAAVSKKLGITVRPHADESVVVQFPKAKRKSELH